MGIVAIHGAVPAHPRPESDLLRARNCTDNRRRAGVTDTAIAC